MEVALSFHTLSSKLHGVSMEFRRVSMEVPGRFHVVP